MNDKTGVEDLTDVRPPAPIATRKTQVTLTIDSGEIDLTEEEARALYSLLRQWYGRKK